MKYLLSFVMLFASLVAVGQTYSKDLEKAAKNGDVAAQRDLGICYLNGTGTTIDNQKAFEWLCQSASQDVQAQYYLGVMFEKGRVDVSKDKKGYYANLKRALNNSERSQEEIIDLFILNVERSECAVLNCWYSIKMWTILESGHLEIGMV